MAETYTYQQTMPDMPGVIVRASDGAFIPMDPANRDYAEFCQLVKDGTVPAPEGWPGPPNE